MMQQTFEAQLRYENEEAQLQTGEKPKNIQLTVRRKSAIKRLFSYTLKHTSLLVWGNIGLVIASLGVVALPYLAGQIVDLIAKDDQNSQEQLNELAVEFILVFIVCAIFSFIRGVAFTLLGEKVVLELRNELFLKLLQKDVEFYDQNRSGELISRITSDVTLIQTACSDTISILLRNIVQFFGSLVLLFLISWKLTLVFLAITPIIAVCVAIFINYYKKYTKEYQNKLALSIQVATESLSNIRVVKSFSTELKEQEIFDKSTYNAYLVGRKRGYLIGLFSGIGMLFGNIAIMCVLWYGGYLVLQGELTVGSLSAFVLYNITLAVSIMSVSGMLNTLLTASAVSEKIFELMDEEVKIQSGNYKPKTNDFNGEIVFKNVNFAYSGKQQVPIIQDMQLTIKSGEVIAFVGHSGSGKSTIVSLIERFYDVARGSILVDQRDIQDYDLGFLHQQIGFVSQEPTLFSGSLRENVIYGKRDATEEEIIQSLKQAHAYEFVANKDYFPEGLKTFVGERGVKLSGGQKQRIAIARALIKNPKILIFDEATSALDSESEYQVQSAIEDLMKLGQKTIIIIAHRLSTIMNCKTIAVFENGKIVEQGTHKDLLQQNGAYKQLIERQLTAKDLI